MRLAREKCALSSSKGGLSRYAVAAAFRRIPNSVNSSAAPAVIVNSTNPMV